MNMNINCSVNEAIKSCKKSFFYIWIFSLFINFLMLIPSLYMLQVYDRVITTKNYHTLAMLSLIVVVLLVFMGGLEWVRNSMLVHICNRIDSSLRKKLYQNCFQLSLITGDITLSYDILKGLDEIRSFVGKPSNFSFFDAPFSLIYIFILFSFNYLLGLIAIFGVAFILIVTFIQEKTTYKSIYKSNKKIRNANTLCDSNFKNVEIIQALGMEEQMQRKWEVLHQEGILHQSKVAFTNSAILAISKSFRIILQSMILGVGAYLVLSQEITPGMMIASSILLSRTLSPIDQIAGNWRCLVSARGRLSQIKDLLNNRYVPQNLFSHTVTKGELEIDNLFVHAAGTKKIAVKGISFGLRSGSSIAIIGPSGSGKSSLVKAILGIWPASSGVVRLDGIDVRTLDKQVLGTHIGYLPQSPELFEGSIAENIARFSSNDEQLIIQAAKMAMVHNLILKLPDGYNTKVGAGGLGLSEGQKQRICLARAIYNIPKLVVLDEPNSNLDEQGVIALNDFIRRIKKAGISIIIISHRSKSLAEIDKVMFLHEGKMKMLGPRDKILSRIRSTDNLSLSSHKDIA
ncbi:type I secretion system permease/ATPase [Neptunomonas phycophila]|uniref:type I secretion system permease/ATPase n=1 Tax=Neptunomonas phycophila TaxID=1572645 RepID=UPI0015BB81AF|nr:type I secretion system permease/ATPase [Neptunomonas phycophila]